MTTMTSTMMTMTMTTTMMMATTATTGMMVVESSDNDDDGECPFSGTFFRYCKLEELNATQLNSQLNSTQKIRYCKHSSASDRFPTQRTCSPMPRPMRASAATCAREHVWHSHSMVLCLSRRSGKTLDGSPQRSRYQWSIMHVPVMTIMHAPWSTPFDAGSVMMIRQA